MNTPLNNRIETPGENSDITRNTNVLIASTSQTVTANPYKRRKFTVSQFYYQYLIGR